MPIKTNSMLYEPWQSENGQVGFKCTSKDGVISYVYLNPSTDEDPGDVPNVFLYQGADGDPALDRAIIHLDLAAHVMPTEKLALFELDEDGQSSGIAYHFCSESCRTNFEMTVANNGVAMDRGESIPIQQSQCDNCGLNF
jgi:hypothetical protein